MALAVVAALAAALRSRPRLLALGAVVALPFRFSLISGGTGGILLAALRRDRRRRAGAGRLGRGGRGAARRLDRAHARVLRRALRDRGALHAGPGQGGGGDLLLPTCRSRCCTCCCVGCTGTGRCSSAARRRVVGLALAFVAVAAVEYASRRLLFHTALNSNQRFFRVNSLFYDPNIYGRFLALTMVLVAAAMMWESSRRRVVLAAAACSRCCGSACSARSRSRASSRCSRASR